MNNQRCYPYQNGVNFMDNKFYITTPIYYPSNKFTLGNCYTTVICDAIARHNRALGKNVFFLTGTDEHGQKIAKKAESVGKTEMQYLDEMIADSKALWKKLDISYDRFIRTTEPEHERAVQIAFKKLYDDGYIYKGQYVGNYCLPCESFWTDAQLVDGKCPDCGREVTKQSEEAYFFKLSQFADKLLDLYKQNPEFLLPTSRVNEMVNNFIKPGLQDLCVSRTSVKWGVKVDFDPNHTVYVWIDALLNYLTALGYNGDEKLMDFWPADVQIMGKEIVRFHAIIWPAILMALNLPLPKRLFGHGWLLFGGDKLSKSKETNNTEVLDPRILIDLYGSDPVRYILLREIPFGSDGVYTTEKFLTRFNSDLCNDYGNLINRTLAMTKKYFDGVVPQKSVQTEQDKQFEDYCFERFENTLAFMQDFNVSKALEEIFAIFVRANKYIDQSMPWQLFKDQNTAQLATVLYNLLDAIYLGTLLLQAFLPECTQKVLNVFGQNITLDKIKQFDILEKVTLGELAPLFPRLDIPAEMEKLAKIASETKG